MGKARANEQKHGFTFVEACEVFDDDDHSSAVGDPVLAPTEN